LLDQLAATLNNLAKRSGRLRAGLLYASDGRFFYGCASLSIADTRMANARPSLMMEIANHGQSGSSCRLSP
jgi:hypothetical protein